MEDQFFVKLSRVTVFKTYYMSFNLMMLQLEDLAGQDEQLVTFRGRCPFHQYMPSKPGKYGIKIWAVCDSTLHYVLKMDVYKRREIGEPRETNLGSKLELKISEPFKKSGRNITCNNFFTNLKLGRKLLMQNLTIVGTIRKNRQSFLQNLSLPKTEKNPLLSMAIKKKR